MAAILRDSVVVVVVVRMRPRVIPLAMITMRKFIDGFPFLSHMRMGLRYEKGAKHFDPYHPYIFHLDFTQLSGRFQAM